MTTRIHHAELWGKRKAKYDALKNMDVEDTAWREIKPQSPFYLFRPQDIKLLGEYQNGWKLTDVMAVNSIGVVTGQDAKTITFSSESASSMAKEHGLNAKVIKSILYRPFDDRFIVYDGSVVTRPRQQVMRHMLAGENFGLIATRQTRDEWQVLATSNICGHKSCAAYDINTLFPVYLYPDPSHPAGRIDEYWPEGKGGRRPNLNPEFVKEMEGELSLKFVSDGTGDLKKTFGPEDVFHYMYAVFHSPTYRSRYAEFLKIDFPRLPLTSDKKLFCKLCGLGAELVSLHLLESPALDESPIRYPVKGDDTVAKGYPKYAPKDSGRVHINTRQYFEPVSKEVWEFHVGGYQVCQKWLKDRRGRKLSYDDITHYCKVVVALGETIRLMAAIDSAISVWPIK